MPDLTPATTQRTTGTPTPGVAPMGRRLLAEFLGTGLLVAVVIGSGIAAQQLSPGQTGLQLLQNSLTTVFGLGVLILWFGPVSGAHFNPVVSAVDWAIGRRTRTGLTGRDLLAYTLAQVLGGIGGAMLANVMFGLAAVQISQHVRATPGLWVGELVATAGLIALILTLAHLDAAHPKRLTTDAVQASDVVVTMGCGDSCPIFPGKRYLDWELVDPAGKTLDQIRPIRDEIDQRVRALPVELTA